MTTQQRQQRQRRPPRPATARGARPPHAAAATATALAAAIAGCAAPAVARPPGAAAGPERPWTPPAAPVAAADGRWVGTYEGRTYRRAGRVELALRARGDGIEGVVVLRDVPAAPPGRVAAAGARDPATRRVVAIPLALARGAARGDSVRLESEAYWDPACGCTLTLTFAGRLRGDTLAGRFRADGSPTLAPERDGRWRVVRTRADP